MARHALKPLANAGQDTCVWTLHQRTHLSTGIVGSSIRRRAVTDLETIPRDCRPHGSAADVNQLVIPCKLGGPGKQQQNVQDAQEHDHALIRPVAEGLHRNR